MTSKEREKLIEDMAQQMLTVAPSSFWSADDLKDMARAALAIAKRRIREDCAEIAAQKPLHLIKETDGQTSYVRGRNDAGLAILASIQETKP